MNPLSIIIPKSPQFLQPFGISLQSGIVAQIYQKGDTVSIYYEGNIYGAENLKSYLQRVYHAASHLIHKYPTIAHVTIPLKDYQNLFLEVGVFDYNSCLEDMKTRNQPPYNNEEFCIKKTITWDHSQQKALTRYTNQTFTKIMNIKLTLPEDTESSESVITALQTLEKEGHILNFEINPDSKQKEDIDTAFNRNFLAQRRAIAEAAFDRHIDRTQEEPEDTDGWTQSGNHYSRVYYVKNQEEPEGPTIRATFSIEFQEGTIAPID